jgi:hypothetical protein
MRIDFGMDGLCFEHDFRAGDKEPANY